jgi:hypothetical protein
MVAVSMPSSRTCTLGRNLIDRDDPSAAATLPLGFAADDTNLYRYVLNSPANVTDPTGLAGVGHHYFPQAILEHFVQQGVIGDKAYWIALGYYTGQTEPNHLFGTYGGFSHDQYSDRVKEFFEEHLKRINVSKKRPIKAEQMADFIETMLIAGNDLDGNPDPCLGGFNGAVEAQRLVYIRDHPSKSPIRPGQKPTIEELFQRGRDFKTTKWWKAGRLAGLLGVAGGVCSTAIDQATGFVEVAAKDQGHYHKAIRKLHAGDLDGGLDELLGSRRKERLYGFYDELIAAGYEKAALSFAEYVELLMLELNANKMPSLPNENQPPRHWLQWLFD